MRTLTLALVLCAGLTRPGTAISIDINISEDSHISEGDRDTTSTVYKAAEGNFETEDACDNTTVSVGQNLAFGNKLDNIIDLQVLFKLIF